MAGRGEPVAAQAAVVGGFVGGLAVGGEAYDDVAGVDVSVVDHVSPTHAGCDGGVDDDGAHKVAHVGSLAPRQVYAYAEVAHLL